MGLSVREVPARDVGVEVVEQRQTRSQRRRGDPVLLGERVEPDLAQEQLGVLGRGGGGGADPCVLDVDDEAQGVRVGGEVPGLDQAHNHFLLAIGVLGEAVVVVIGHVEVLERGAGAVHSRLAGHVLLVDARRERLRRPGRLIADIAPVVLHQLTQ